MAFIIGCIPLLLIAAAMARTWNKPFALTLPAATLGGIFLLYLFGLLGLLRIGVYALYALGLAAAAFLALPLIRGERQGWKAPSPAILMAILAVPVICFVSRGRLMLIWDEFSHWGVVVKNMYLLDEFGSSAASTAIYKSYPPSIGLLQYYFMRLEGVFTEATLYRAKDFLTLSLLLPFFEKTAWKDVKELLLLTVIVFCLPLIDYYYFYRSIHVDGLMGLLFLYILIAYYRAEAGDLFSYACVALGIFALAMIKSSGAGFCLLILLLLAVDWLYRRKDAADMAPPRGRRLAGSLLLPCAALLFAAVTWRINLAVSGAADYWNAAAALSPQRLLFAVQNPQPYQSETLERFFSALFALRDDTYAVRLSPLSWIGLTVVPCALSWLVTPAAAEKKRVGRICLLLLAGYAIWLIVLLFSFLFLFADFEALNLDGFERYTSTYQLGAMGFSLYLLLTSWRENRKERFAAYLSLLLCAQLCFFTFSDMAKATVLAPQYNAYTRAQRAGYPAAPAWPELDPARDRVLFIGQQSEATGLDFYYNRYLKTPLYVGMIGSWSVGEKYGNSDDWTAPFTLEDWTRAVYDSDYTHIYLFAVDERFAETFGPAFANPADIADGALLSVSRNGGGLTLTRAE